MKWKFDHDPPEPKYVWKKIADNVQSFKVIPVPLGEDPLNWFTESYKPHVEQKLKCPDVGGDGNCTICKMEMQMTVKKNYVPGKHTEKFTTKLVDQSSFFDMPLFEKRAQLLVAPWVEDFVDPVYVPGALGPFIMLHIYGRFSGSAELAVLALALEFDCEFRVENKQGVQTNISFFPKPPP